MQADQKTMDYPLPMERKLLSPLESSSETSSDLFDYIFMGVNFNSPEENEDQKVSNCEKDERPWICDICGKSFKRKNHLSCHKRYHKETNPPISRGKTPRIALHCKDRKTKKQQPSSTEDYHQERSYLSLNFLYHSHD